MKSIFRSRRHRNPHQLENQKKPFFSKVHDQASEPFFSSSADSIQAKLTIGQPGDKYEQEADAVANHVVNNYSPASAIQRQEVSSIQRVTLASPQEDEKLGTAESRMEKDKLIQEKPEIQRQAGMEEEPAKELEEPMNMMHETSEDTEQEEPVNMMGMGGPGSEEKEEAMGQAKSEEEETMGQNKSEEEEAMGQTKGKDEEEAMGQAKGEEEDMMHQAMDSSKEEERLQRKEKGGSAASCCSGKRSLKKKLKKSARKGVPLPENIRTEMEEALQADFSEVRIHTGMDAEDMNKALGAVAFTRGKHIYFKDGKYDPESPSGKKLLVHELTHVVQQSGGSIKRAK